jgi:hypothetical protein
MLAEIYMLRAEAAVRANKEDATFAPKFVPFDWARRPSLKAPPPWRDQSIIE